VRKSLIALVGLAFVWAAGNLYACDGKAGAKASNAGANSQKTEMSQAGGSCQPDSKNAAAVQTGEAKTMTTESHSCPYMKESAEKTGVGGSCCVSKGNSVSPDKSKAKAKESSAAVEKAARNSDPLLIVGAPIDLGSTVQK
jgi:hypothetical protein